MNDSRQLRRRIGGKTRDRLGLGIALQLQHFQKRLGLERRSSSQQRVKYSAQAVLVAAVGDHAAIGLLGSHVLGRSQNASIGRHARVAEQSRNAEVGELDVAVGRQQQISRFEIAVNHAVIVRVLERRQSLMAI